MKNALPWLGIAVAVILTAGCGNGGFKDDGVPASFKSEAADANSLAKSVDGNFDKLSPEGKSKILQMANGDEAAARKLTMMMAHPPNEAMKAAHGGNGGN